MAGKDSSDRSLRIASMTTMLDYHWMFLRTLSSAVRGYLGEAGLAALERGFRRAGYYRGQRIRDRPETFAEGRDALALIRHWDMGEHAMAAETGPFEISGSAAQATLTFPHVPGADYFSTHPGGEILEPYWRNTLAGIAEGYDASAGVECSAVTVDLNTPWQLTWTYRGESEEVTAGPPEDVFAQPARAIQLTRSTFAVFAVMQMYVGFELIDRFDASGERALREALYQFGVERGQGMREQALSQGRSLDFQSWFEVLQERDPAESVFVFRGDTRISPGVMQAECTYCPLAEVWSEEGERGLKLGYMYDVEVHRGLVESYHPGGRIGWNTVKTRGDRTCTFHFSIPDLVTADDPDWAQPRRTKPGRAQPKS